MDPKHLIVIVDDDPDDRLLIHDAISKTWPGAVIAECTDGISFLELVNDNPFDLPLHAVILDINMPRFSGWEVLEHLRTKPDLCEAPIILFSTSYDERDVTRAMRLGAKKYLQKPYIFTGYMELSEKIKSLVPGSISHSA
jgi:two-component system, chemotaxis family, response regulator Rcp1